MSNTNDTNIQAESEKRGSSGTDSKHTAWKILAPLAGAAAVYLAYLVGVASHETYLDSFAVSPGGFPKEHPEYLVYAFAAVLKDLGLVLHAITWKVILCVIGTLVAMGAVSWFLAEGAAALGRRHRGRSGFSAGPRVKSFIMYCLAVPFFGTYLMFALPTAVAAIMVIPVELGAAAGKISAADDMADFKKGCAAHSHGKHCVALREGKQTVAMGFIIEQSKDTVALWDNGTVQVLPLEKRALVSVDGVL